MKLIRHPQAKAFLDRSERWLLRAEAEHSVIVSVAHALLGDEHPFEAPIYMATVEERGDVVGCALRPPPDGLTLTGMPAAAVPALARDLAGAYASLPDVSGPEAEARAFAAHWCELRGCDWSLACRFRWYRADRVVEPPPTPGALRSAEEPDLPWVSAWASAYADEVWTASVDVPAFFARRVRTRSLYVWDDGGPRSVVALSGLTPNSARISAVYTPPAHRRRGYATAATAAVTQAVLDGGRWCVLSADVANPTANRIYRSIGYRRTCDTAVISFAARG